MFTVEIRVEERDEDALTARMTAMREWLDHRHFEPSTFRYSFAVPGLVFQADFKLEAEAAAFATAFSGHATGNAADMPGQGVQVSQAVD